MEPFFKDLKCYKPCCLGNVRDYSNTATRICKPHFSPAPFILEATTSRDGIRREVRDGGLAVDKRFYWDFNGRRKALG